MDESLYLQTIPENGEPVAQTKDALTAEIFQPFVEALIDAIWDELLHSIATRKEWYFYKHAKKRETRKKYKRRLTLRLLAAMQEANDE